MKLILCISEASVEKEDDHKFIYVVKGPARTQQKKVFYVYGKGWNAKDGTVVRPTTTKEMGQDPAWPLRQHPNDVYYDLTFLDHGNCSIHTTIGLLSIQTDKPVQTVQTLIRCCRIQHDQGLHCLPFIHQFLSHLR